MSLRTRFPLFLLILLTTAGLQAYNLTGRVTCEDSPLIGVAVSDGDTIVLTDGQGCYQMQSQKRNGYVFCILPGGYAPEVEDGFRPRFWTRLTSASTLTPEVHDFRLKRQDDTHFRMVIGADTHLANRRKDLMQFCDGFIAALGREQQQARAEGIPAYSMLLGDLGFDTYWFECRYTLRDFMQTCRRMHYPLPLYPVIGNHDNDPTVAEGPWTDFLSSGVWRDVVCPNYYSFNIGHAHFVVLDNVDYQNLRKEGVTYAVGAAGTRNYEARISEDQFRWLRQDLALLPDKDAPLIVAFHVPSVRLRQEDGQPYFNMEDQCTERLCHMVKDFRQVHFLSGHTHMNNCIRMPQYAHITEHNINGVCAIWWASWLLSGRHNCKDGTPAGYSVWDFDGNQVQWRFRAIQEPYDSQFRMYDLNSVGRFYAQSPTMRSIIRQYPKRHDYAAQQDSNLVLVNVYAWADDWQVDILEDGRPLQVSRVRAEDPYHVLCYEVPFYKKHKALGKGSSTYANNWHMFRAACHTADHPVTVRVTDGFGRIQQRTLQRPLPYNLKTEIDQGRL